MPMRRIVVQGLAEVVQVLLQAPHVLTQRDGRRKLPLDIATERKHDHLVQLLAAEQSQLPGSSAGKEMHIKMWQP